MTKKEYKKSLIINSTDPWQKCKKKNFLSIFKIKTITVVVTNNREQEVLDCVCVTR